ncbi:hypothetical protein D3C83_318760 [compost metagenome]
MGLGTVDEGAGAALERLRGDAIRLGPCLQLERLSLFPQCNGIQRRRLQRR